MDIGLSMKVYLDISPFWPKNESGEPKSVNSVFEELQGTPNKVSRNTLSLALHGRTDRIKLDNLVKLRRVASVWAGREVVESDLLRVVEDEE